jgi:hemolysin activation/secretion protein/AraC-like DNA-binding protein
MHKLNQLGLEAVKLAAGEEWMDGPGAWRFVRVHSGAAYWLGSGNNRPLAEGEVLVAPPLAEGVVRASQIGEVELHGFKFAPEMLCGFFTLAERDFLEARGRDAAGQVRFLPSTHPLAQQFAVASPGRAAEQPLALRVAVLGLVAAVFDEELARYRPAQVRGSSAQDRFDRLIVKMPETELINHAPEELARLAGCSPRHFNRLFRERFGLSARARQTELRLLKARQLLSASDEKVINIAVATGYRNLSLFNALFKKRFGQTPSQWRKGAAKAPCRPRRAAGLVVWLVLFASAALLRADPATLAPVTPSPQTAPVAVAAPAAPAKPAAAPLTFRVKGYELEGNTLLTPEMYEPIFARYTGEAVTFEVIRLALADLQLAYRHRGFMTVAVSLPQQQLTNGVVRVKVTEGRLVAVTVKNNQYFDTRNILRLLPSARTNTLLNALVFQQELDRANANNDRQIYPVIAPGPEPGTTVLELRVKDRLPFHLHMELNNYATPGTPDLRMNLSGVYNNLWQLDHQLGLSYSMTPEALKDDSPHVQPYDRPLIASYSMFYRMPLQPLNGYPRAYTAMDFGWDEAAHRFRPPPLSGAAELIVYGSRSYSDTGSAISSQTLTPAVVPPGGGIQISDSTTSRTLNPNENLGMRLSKPLPPLGPLSSTVSAGLDFKNYRSLVEQTRTFGATIWVPNSGTNGYISGFKQFVSPPNTTSRSVFTSVEYLPLTLDWSGAVADKHGSTEFDVSQSYNPGLVGRREDFQAVAGSTNIDGKYYVVTASATRDQKVWHDWAVKLKADGQWADQALINNEMYGKGGNAGPRGFLDGSLYSDGGWRLMFEPHSPWIDTGMVDGDLPMLARFSIFTDYVANDFVYRRSAAPAYKGNPWTAGFTFSLAVGAMWDFRMLCGWVLPGGLATTSGAPLPSYLQPGMPHVAFSLNGQF